MTAVAERLVITEPGVYDLPAEVYHSDPVEGGSLSSTGARKLLPPSCPALYRREVKTTRAMEIGTAAHKVVLGVGPKLHLIERDVWNTKEVKAEVAQIRADGGIPLKRADWDQVHAMADALREHPIASAVLNHPTGVAEQTLVWRDEPTGVWCRALLDWRAGRTVVDYKTTDCASPAALAKTVANFGYAQQGAWYLDGAQALNLAGQGVAFLLIAQEKTAPYLVTVAQIDPDSIEFGRARNRRALEIYRDCTASGIWPGYGNGVALVRLPAWATRDQDEEEML